HPAEYQSRSAGPSIQHHDARSNCSNDPLERERIGLAQPGSRLGGPVAITDWFLTPAERGNAVTLLDRRHLDGASWTVGNNVQALIHGASYFPFLLRSVRAMAAGDLLMFTDW